MRMLSFQLVVMRGYFKESMKKKSIRKSGKNVLVLHGGDAFQGTIYFTQNKGMNAAAWKLLRLDAMAPATTSLT